MGKLTKILGAGILAAGLTTIGYSTVTISKNIQSYNWGGVDAPTKLWDSYDMEDVFELGINWERYQELVKRVNGKTEFNEGERVTIPDLDHDGNVWSNGKKYSADIRS